MAGRTADISTSSFKPLSLNEIMMVPLAMQAKEDNLNQLALDEFSALQSNALAADKEYVTGQVEALKKESGSITDDLMTNGYSKNLFNKFRKLKSKKDNELSIMGKTGQAAAAYNQYEANKANIMKDPRLTADQKKLGLQEALGLYESSGGAAGGAQYQDYVGAAHIDAMQKARDIAKEISPQEIAKRMGISQNAQGLYEENGYLTKTLSSETISDFVKQSLEGDADLMAYANEYERLGLGAAEDMIAKAAESAGNIYQRKDYKDNSKLLSAGLQEFSSNKGVVAPPSAGENWDSYMDVSTAGVFNETLEMPDIENSNMLFDTNGVFLEIAKGEEALYDNEDIRKSNKIIEYSEEKGYKSLTGKEKRAYNRSLETIKYYKKTQHVDLVKAQDLVSKVRENNPVFNNTVKADKTPYTDKDVYDIFLDAKKRSALTASQVVFPKNPKNTFYADGNRMIGSDGSAPSIVTRNVQLMTRGGDKGNYLVMMSQLGYGNDTGRFLEDMKSGKADSYSPGIPGMPGARKITFRDSNTGEFHTMYAEPSIKEADAFKNVENINALIHSGAAMKELPNLRNNAGQYAIAELRPETGRYEGGIVTTQPNVKLTQEDLSSIKYDPVVENGRTLPGIFIGKVTTGEFKGETVFRKSLDAEIQSGIDKINRYYDTTKNAATSGKEAAAGKIY